MKRNQNRQPEIVKKPRGISNRTNVYNNNCYYYNTTPRTFKSYLPQSPKQLHTHSTGISVYENKDKIFVLSWATSTYGTDKISTLNHKTNTISSITTKHFRGFSQSEHSIVYHNEYNIFHFNSSVTV